MIVRRWFGSFLPLSVVATSLAILLYVVAQQLLRMGANDPQFQVAHDAAARLSAGAAPASIVGSRAVDLATSLGAFTVVADASGTISATDGVLDGGPPTLPVGVLADARRTGIDSVTWQPRPGARFATVTVPWTGGTVTVGRSLRLVEERVDQLGLLVLGGWVATLVALAAAVGVGVRLSPPG